MRLDVEKLESRISRTFSTEESLQDVEPFCWDDDILSGEKRVEVSRVECFDRRRGHLTPGQMHILLETVPKRPDRKKTEKEAMEKLKKHGLRV